MYINIVGEAGELCGETGTPRGRRNILKSGHNQECGEQKAAIQRLRH